MNRTAAAVLLAAVAWAALTSPAWGQDEDALTTASGAALGLYSAGTMGLVGSLFPCDRTLLGRACPAVSTALSGGVGLVTGGFIGADSKDQLRDRARGAAYGTLIGAVMGSVLQYAVRQYAWDDALLVAGIGGAFGGAPVGAALGAGAGAVVGGLAWALSPRAGPQDMILFTVLGSALGGLADWTYGAVDAGEGGGPGLTSSFSIPIG